MRVIEWIAGPHGGWDGIAFAVGIAVLVAYAVAAVAVRLARSALANFAFAEGAADRGRQWQKPIRVARTVIFVAVLAALLLPALDLAGAGVPVQASRGALISWFVGSGLRILVVALLTYLMVRVISTSTERLEAQVMHGGGPDRVEHIKRARTLGRLVKNALTSLVLGVALLMILRELNVDIMPVLTGAGIVGLAVGFGAQTLVKDLISGAFLILDDNVRVGDVARINGTGGLVEAINLRTIVLRDHEGTVHVFPNGSITTLSNLTKDFAYAVVDVGFSYGEDTDRVVDVLRRVGADVTADPGFAPNVLAPVEVQAVEAFGNGQMTVRVRIKARPLTQWDIGRELRRRIKKAFDAEGIQMPAPPGTVTLLQSVPAASTETPAPTPEPTDGSAPGGPRI
ncbi:MAG: mechanosensitive ion channel family protein [Vicinamibacteraceae bacterium]